MISPRIGRWLLISAFSLAACHKPQGNARDKATADAPKTTSQALTAAKPEPPPKPDYADPGTWLCRPGRDDACSADLTTTIVRANGSMAQEPWKPNPNPEIDCFYVYPTVSQDSTPNSDMVAGHEEKGVVRAQAARFGSQCRVFAPIYRQVTLSALRAAMRGQPIASDAERALAYGDVADAFKYYLEHDNDGRGFVLIGHSQGASVLLKLAKEEVDGKPVQKQLVSALLIGTNVNVPKGKDVGGSFQHIPLCHSATQVGCAVSYASFRSNAPPPSSSRFGKASDAGLVAACTNPAALRGGTGKLHAYLTSGHVLSSAEPRPWVKSGRPVTTPFVSVPGLLSAKCMRREGGAYLAVTVHGNPKDPRVDDIVGDLVSEGKVQADWGLHVIDMSLAMGNLVELVGSQSKHYRAH